jgi:phosphatidylethanolamine/phosphatidyl-N-methylethanolamine N-methyltransferase
LSHHSNGNVNSEQYFREAYNQVMYTGSIGVYSKIVHTMMEKKIPNNTGLKILELGAGSGEHYPYVVKPYAEYVVSDLDVSLLKPLKEQKIECVKVKKINAEKLSFIPENTYDRLIATCLLAHLNHPVDALQRWREVVKNGGTITIYVPSEPGMMLRLFRKLFVAPKSKKYGQNHMSMIYRDHRNHYPAMRQHIQDVFHNDIVKKRSFPFPFFGWNFNFFTLYTITVRKPF